MKLGVCVPNYGEASTPDAIQRIAVEAEQMGFDSVWCTDHLLMPRNSGTPYERIFESITTLAHLAGVTSKVTLGIRSEEHTSELQSPMQLVCRLLLEKT